MKLAGIEFGATQSLGKQNASQPIAVASAWNQSLGVAAQVLDGIYDRNAEAEFNDYKNKLEQRQQDLLAAANTRTSIRPEEIEAAGLSVPVSATGEHRSEIPYYEVSTQYQRAVTERTAAELRNEVTNSKALKAIDAWLPEYVTKHRGAALKDQLGRQKDADFAKQSSSFEGAMKAGDATGAEAIARQMIGGRLVSRSDGQGMIDGIPENIAINATYEVLTEGTTADKDELRKTLSATDYNGPVSEKTRMALVERLKGSVDADVREATAARVEADSDWVTDRIEAARNGQTTFAEINALRDDPRLGATNVIRNKKYLALKATLKSWHNQQKTDSNNAIAFADLVMNGGSYQDSDDMRVAGAEWKVAYGTLRGQEVPHNKAAAQATLYIMEATDIIPNKAKKYFRLAAQNGVGGDLIQAATIYNTFRENGKESVMHQLDNDTHGVIQNAASLLRAEFPPEVIQTMIDSSNYDDPDAAAMLDAKWRKDTGEIAWMDKSADVFNELTSSDPDAGIRIATTYQQLTRAIYNSNGGKLDEALELATARTKATFSVTDVDGERRVSELAVETYYPEFAKADATIGHRGDHRERLEAEIQSYSQEGGKVTLQPIRDQRKWVDGRPVYRLMEQTELGPRYITSLAWSPDITSAVDVIERAKAIKGEKKREEQKAIEIEAKRQAAIAPEMERWKHSQSLEDKQEAADKITYLNQDAKTRAEDSRKKANVGVPNMFRGR